MSLLLERCSKCYFDLLEYDAPAKKDTDEWRYSVDEASQAHFQIRNDPIKAAVRHGHVGVVRQLLSGVYEEIATDFRYKAERWAAL